MNKAVWPRLAPAEENAAALPDLAHVCPSLGLGAPICHGMAGRGHPPEACSWHGGGC